MEKYAYVRVSTKEQKVDRQLKALEPFEVPKKNIYCDHQSGKAVKDASASLQAAGAAAKDWAASWYSAMKAMQALSM